MNHTPLPDIDIVATTAAVALTPRALGSPAVEPSRLPTPVEVGAVEALAESGAEKVHPVEIVAWVATCWSLPCEVLPSQSLDGSMVA